VKHYLSVIGGPLIIARTPWPMPRWREILRALTTVMRSHGLLQKDISLIEGLVPDPTQERDTDDQAFIARLEAAYEGDVTILPKFWLYDWRHNSFQLVREGT
jgi:hypothetical protein